MSKKAQEIHDAIQAAIEGAINPEDIGKKIASDPGLLGLYGLCKILGRVERHLRVISRSCGNKMYPENVMANMIPFQTRFKVNGPINFGKNSLDAGDQMVYREMVTGPDWFPHNGAVFHFSSNKGGHDLSEEALDKLIRFNMIEVIKADETK